MRNKKGFLLGEFTLKVIIAVISLSLLVYLLFLIYGAFAGESDDVDKAKDLLSTIISKIGTDVMPKGSYQMVLVEPKGTLAFFPDGKPEADCDKDCLCLHVGKGMLRKGTFVCKTAEGVVIENPIEIKDPVDLTITLTDKDKAIEEWKYVFTTE